MRPPNANTWVVALNTLKARAWKAAHEKGREYGYSEYDVSLAFGVELKAAGLEIKWARGRKPHALDVRAVIDGTDQG